MTSPFALDVLREALPFLEEEFPVLSDPPATTREAAVAVLCCRLRYAIHSAAADGTDDLLDPGLVGGHAGGRQAGPEDEFGGPGEDDPPPVGKEYRPFGWTPDFWEEPDELFLLDADETGNRSSDADPAL